MLLSKLIRLKADLSRYVLHAALILGVGVYAICGAIIFQSIEQPSNSADSRSLQKRNQETEKQRWLTLTGADIARHLPSVDDCVLDVLKRIANSKSCPIGDIDASELDDLDLCYINAAFSNVENPRKQSFEAERKAATGDENEKWNFVNAVIFSYTVITTIGYGHIAPVTLEGRVFCIFYGLIGIPFTLLTIADLGMFISKILQWAASGMLRVIRLLRSLELLLRRENTSLNQNNIKSDKSGMAVAEKDKTGDRSSGPSSENDSEVSERSVWESVVLGIAFVLYLVLGSYVFSLYEPDMNFLKAIYFNFVTLTTIGLGDLVPRSNKFLLVTLIYTTVGLALTTIAMEIAANLLKKIHYFGRQVENVSNVTVWFGGKKMSMKKLVQHLGDHMNVPVDELTNLNLDTFVKSAIKVEAGEIKTLRKPKIVMRAQPHPSAFRYSFIRKSCESESLRYIDEKRSSSIFESVAPLANEAARTSPGHTSYYSTFSSEATPVSGRSDEIILDSSQLSEANFVLEV